MRFIEKEMRLETDAGELIKTFECPMDKRWDDLMPWSDDWAKVKPNDNKRLCGACGKCVVNFQNFREPEIIAIVKVSPNVCGYLTKDHPDLTEVVYDSDTDIEMYRQILRMRNGASNCTITNVLESGERIIHTARSLAAIKEGIEKGFRPFFVPNEPNGLTHQKLSIVYDHDERTLHVSNDYRSMRRTDVKGDGIYLDQDMRRHPSPVAAYMLPLDIQLGERVYLEDLIEDRPGSGWNQGDRYRARSCFALWRGDQMELELPEKLDPSFMVVG